jgi:hypothetical protein
MDKGRFSEACQFIIGQERKQNGIGTLGEKTLHAILKQYYEPYRENQEIKIGGYVADIVGENGIIEIQTRSFERLRKKLAAFLPVCPVTVVYPIPKNKWISWINLDTGEAGPKRKSPKIGSPQDAFFELYKIKTLLSHPNLSIHLLLLDLEEYRYLNGWSHDKKRGSSRCDRIPLCICEEVILSCPQDYALLLPQNLPDPFTVKDLQKTAKLSPRSAQCGIAVLRELGLITHIGKSGRAYLYSRSKTEESE